MPDARRDYGEVREIGVGVIGERLYCVVFTQRGDAMHVISLRKAADSETYELDAQAFKQLRKLGRPRKTRPKVAVTILYDHDVIEAFKAEGEGWQTRMNDVLRAWVKEHRPQ